ncbi:hypothetical protein LguiA_016353 [Lonicera macranthoides]
MGESSKSIEDLYAHLDLGQQDGVNMDFNEIPGEESNKEPQWCLVGKLLTRRTVNFMAIKTRITEINKECWIQFGGDRLIGVTKWRINSGEINANNMELDTEAFNAGGLDNGLDCLVLLKLFFFFLKSQEHNVVHA